MIIVTNTVYPPESANEMAKRFLEAPQLPDFMTRNGPFFSGDLSNGIHGISFYDVEDPKLGEAMEFLGNYFSIFFGVTGFKYDFKMFYKVEKALKMIGMG